MILSASAAPVEIEVQAPTSAATGSDLDLAIGCRAADDVEVTGIDAALVARMTYAARQIGMPGAASVFRGRRTEVHSEQHVPGPWPLARGESVTFPVRLHVPETGFGTARSELVAIEWSARVRLGAKGHTYAEASQVIDVRSDAGDRAFVAMSLPRTDDRGVAALSFGRLSTRVLSPGRALSGTVTITPLRLAVARAARVVVVLRQQVHHTEWEAVDRSRHPDFVENERETLLSAAQLGEDLELSPGRPLSLAFRLPAKPALPAPSIQAPPFRLNWILRAELDRGLRRRPFVEVELHGRTAPG